MRVTALREQMAAEFGTVRAEMLASAHVFSELDGRTVEQALADGVPVKQIWLAVCEGLDVPAERR